MSDDERSGKSVPEPRMNARMRAKMKLAADEDGSGGGKRAAKNQLGPDGEASDSDDDAPRGPQVATAQQMAQRKIFSVKVPQHLQNKAPAGGGPVKAAFSGLSAAARPAPKAAPELHKGGLMNKVTPPSPEHAPMRPTDSPKSFSLDSSPLGNKPNPFAAQLAAHKAKQPEANAFEAESKDKKPNPFGFKANVTADANPFAAAKKNLPSAGTAAPVVKVAETATFHAADPSSIVTGEEGEETEVQEQMKLFALCSNEWVDRGSGMLKVNSKEAAVEGGARKGRLIMRSLATKQSQLNANLDNTFKLVKAAENHVIFASSVQKDDGSVETTSYLLKGKSSQTAVAQVSAVLAAIRKFVS